MCYKIASVILSFIDSYKMGENSDWERKKAKIMETSCLQSRQIISLIKLLSMYEVESFPRFLSLNVSYVLYLNLK
jgi:hypothetical protein